MIKAAIEKIADMAAPHFHLTEDKALYYDDGKCAHLLEAAPQRDYSNKTTVHSLDALIKMVKKELIVFDREGCARPGRLWPIDGRPEAFYISVPSPTEVRVYTTPVYDGKDIVRRCLMTAEATDVPGFHNTIYNYEEAIIALRSKFAPNEDQAYVLELMSRLSVENAVETEDDGVTQRATVRSGVKLVKQVEVRPIVALQPYRTFAELEQPVSQFLIRIDPERRLSLTEADGGMWRLAARKTIAQYLENQLANEIATGHLIVML